MNEVYEFLKKCGTYYLATVEGYKPRVRPFGTIDLIIDCISKLVKLKLFRDKLKRILK